MRAEFGGGFHQDVLVVKPFGFVQGEFGAGLADFVDGEQVDEFVHGHQFLVVAGIPAQQRQHVDDGFRQVTRFAVARRGLARFGIMPLQREYRESEAVAVALAQFAISVGFEQQRKVGELRCLPAESFVEHHMKWCRGKPFLASDHMRDFHQMVVHNVGQVVSGHTVGFV